MTKRVWDFQVLFRGKSATPDKSGIRRRSEKGREGDKIVDGEGNSWDLSFVAITDVIIMPAFGFYHHQSVQCGRLSSDIITVITYSNNNNNYYYYYLQ